MSQFDDTGVDPKNFWHPKEAHFQMLTYGQYNPFPVQLNLLIGNGWISEPFSDDLFANILYKSNVRHGTNIL